MLLASTPFVFPRLAMPQKLHFACHHSQLENFWFDTLMACPLLAPRRKFALRFSASHTLHFLSSDEKSHCCFPVTNARNMIPIASSQGPALTSKPSRALCMAMVT